MDSLVVKGQVGCEESIIVCCRLFRRRCCHRRRHCHRTQRSITDLSRRFLVAVAAISIALLGISAVLAEPSMTNTMTTTTCGNPVSEETSKTQTASSREEHSGKKDGKGGMVKVGRDESIPTLRVILIRHGESQNNIYHEISRESYLANRVPDPALTLNGQRQAQQTAEYLSDGSNALFHQIDEMYVSPFLRTLQTAQPIARALHLNPRIWTDIHEVGGVFDGPEKGKPGMTRTEITEAFETYDLPEDDSVTEHGWYFLGRKETREEGRERVDRVWKALKQRAEEERAVDRTIALVVHGDVIDFLMQNAVGISGTEKIFPCFNTCICVLDLTPSSSPLKTRVLFHNFVSHLSPELIKTDKLGKC